MNNMIYINFITHIRYSVDHENKEFEEIYARKSKKDINFRLYLTSMCLKKREEIFYCINNIVEIDQFFIKDVFNVKDKNKNLILKISPIEINNFIQMNIKTESIKDNVNYLCSILTSTNFNEEYYLFNTATKLILKHFNTESLNQNIWISYDLINKTLEEVEEVENE